MLNKQWLKNRKEIIKLKENKEPIKKVANQNQQNP